MLTLQDAIAMLRDEIGRAAAAAATSGPNGVFMTIEDAQIELQVILTSEIKGNAEVNVWVVKLGAQTGTSVGDSHKVTITVKPRAHDGGPIQVASTGSNLPSPPPTPSSIEE